jgi:hypothetical protein
VPGIDNPKGSPLRLALPNHLRPRREKKFGDGPRIPLEREAKVRIMHLARALKHKTEPGKHYGVLIAPTGTDNAHPAPPCWWKHRKLLSDESRHSRQCPIVIDF